MKLHILKLALSLLALAICCKAGFNFGSAGDATENLRVALTEAQRRFSDDDDGRLVVESAWQGDSILYNNIVTHLHKPGQKFSHLGTVDGYDLYGMDWKLRLAQNKEPKDRVFIFAMQHRRDGRFEPLGFARYDFDNARHNQDAFWSHSGYYRSIKGTQEMREKQGFPPQFLNPTRSPAVRNSGP